MRGNWLWLILGVIGTAVLVLILNRDGGTLFGLGENEFGRFVYLGIWALVLAVAVLSSRVRLRDAARNAVLWLLILLVLVGGYLYRYELQDFASRLSGGLLPGSPVSGTTADGRPQITVLRSSDGHFRARGQVDGQPVSFLVDTGASTIVLTDADAQRAGIDTQTLSYSVPVTTANGATTAARVTLGELSIGQIGRERIGALVARPEALQTSLLGMNFLSSLYGFEIRGDRLILTE